MILTIASGQRAVLWSIIRNHFSCQFRQAVLHIFSVCIDLRCLFVAVNNSLMNEMRGGWLVSGRRSRGTGCTPCTGDGKESGFCNMHAVIDGSLQHCIRIVFVGRLRWTNVSPVTAPASSLSMVHAQITTNYYKNNSHPSVTSEWVSRV